MFKFFALCVFALLAVAFGKPQFLTAYSAASPVVAATPYAYSGGIYASPYSAAYTSGVYASPYTYGAYPYSSLYLRR
ncbi:uncharacterized protein LOC128258954 [Drosophila gunungcola]|uniref:Neuropeptide-like 4 n=1 Tax=Drosophila gunungcola TaxID=103775 RepID=A0A9Q0BP27_9MUSC|nr:uncharacterized protein LOC108145807 [Drosophila elegans]XP_052846964.1 uncharacterized protein LOC128258954 [Drosophila gunungcola]KAI8039352.1 hypothetical protein M5D96_008075 [Drosophila gunungcola]